MSSSKEMTRTAKSRTSWLYVRWMLSVGNIQTSKQRNPNFGFGKREKDLGARFREINREITFLVQELLVF